jgi:8-oxo-dGTP diphosphatase
MPKTEQGVTADRYAIIPRTLIFITRGSSVLLIQGAPTKRLWANRYNGIGGHIQRGESVLASAHRELHEETGLAGIPLRLVGTVMIDASEQRGIGLFVLRGEYLGGDLVESLEGKLEWVPFEDLQAVPLVEDLHILLPHILAMNPTHPPFSALYHYDENDQLRIKIEDSKTG